MTADTIALPPIAILGAGSMGGAILHGLVRSGLASNGVTVTNRTATKAAELGGARGRHERRARVRSAGEPGCRGRCSIVILVGVKPAMVPDLLREIAPVLRPGTIVVILAAGVTIATFESILGDGSRCSARCRTPPPSSARASPAWQRGTPRGRGRRRRRAAPLRDRRDGGRGARVSDRRAVDDLGLRSRVRLPPHRGAHQGCGGARDSRGSDARLMARADVHRRRRAARGIR